MPQWGVLSALIAQHRDLIIARTREKVASRPLPRATAAEMEHGVPLFLQQLTDRLRDNLEEKRGDISASATLHGAELHRSGVTIGQVVHDYGDICQVVTELAGELHWQITNHEFQLLNLCLDIAIADAVTEYARQREVTMVGEGTERLASLAHELRNLLNVATLAFRALSTNRVGIGGSTGTVLSRTLASMGDLVSRSLAEVRLDVGIATRDERVVVADVFEEVEIAAHARANARNIQLSLEMPDPGLAVCGDAQIVSAIMTNLVQNAYKFTREGSLVRLSARTEGDQVFIDVADECGGLPPGRAEELFLPFQQCDTDRSGVGLGLTISRKGAQAVGGALSVRDIPGTGCVFTLQLRAFPAAPSAGAST